MSAASHPRLPGLEGAVPPVHAGEALRRAVLRAVAAAEPAPVRAEELAPALGAGVRAIAAELTHLRHERLVWSRDAAPGFRRGMLWQATEYGLSALSGPDVREAELAVLSALRDGSLPTSALVRATGLRAGAVCRSSASLRVRGLCVLAGRVTSPLGGAEGMHELTAAGWLLERAAPEPVAAPPAPGALF